MTATTAETDSKETTKMELDYYFNSYSHFSIHEEMLKDEVRTMSYRDAIYHSRHLFQDKIVLDVGCGTGILSMFAVKAGAKHVYGIDMSNIIHKAREIVADNGFADRITLIQGKMEEITLPVDKVDIIISEWMGYALLYESMCDTVLYARDRYLAPGGLMFPDKASLHLSVIEDAEYREEKIDFWDNVYGFTMSAIKKVALREPLVDTVNEKAVVAKPCCFKEFDLSSVTKEELSFTAPFRMEMMRQDYVHAFLLWFDIGFTACHKPVYFSTGPHAKYTHWKQTVFYLHDNELAVKEGEVIQGELMCRPNKENPRDLDFEIRYVFDGESGHVEGNHEYHMC